MFFKFPHTPHLLWLAKSPCRDDKVLTPTESEQFLSAEVTVEEKVDGSNIGFSLDERGQLRVQNRGNYLARGAHPQFQPLWPWMDSRRAVLLEALKHGIMLFGEWCFVVHSVRYQRLPDWFLGFDVYDRLSERFWSAERRDSWMQEFGFEGVPRLARGRFSKNQLLALLTKSRLGNGPAEGIYLRNDCGDWLERRAKIVRAEFVEGIDRHWSETPLERNEVRASASNNSSWT